MKSWICTKIEIAWLPAVSGCALIEGRVGDARVFGLALPGPRMFVWADEATIKAAILSSPKTAKARLVCEVEKLGESLPAMLPSISGLGHESMIEGTKIEIDKDGKPSVSKNREIGFENDGGATVKPVAVQESVAPAPAPNEEPNEA